MQIPYLDHDLPGWVARLIGLAGYLLLVVLVHRILFAVLRRVTERTKTRADDILVLRLRRPTFWLMIGVALAAATPGLDLPRVWENVWQRLLGIAARFASGLKSSIESNPAATLSWLPRITTAACARTHSTTAFGSAP